MIHSKDDLAQAIQRYGIFPFFTNRVPGWSVEEMCDPAVYFTDQPGPWEWKGPLAAEKTCVYGKFIQNKAAFISPEWFPDLANYRRNGYAWDEWADLRTGSLQGSAADGLSAGRNIHASDG